MEVRSAGIFLTKLQIMFNCRLDHDEVKFRVPWLKAIDNVGRMLGGVHKCVCSYEIVAVVQLDWLFYSRGAIRGLIKGEL